MFTNCEATINIVKQLHHYNLSKDDKKRDKTAKTNYFIHTNAWHFFLPKSLAARLIDIFYANSVLLFAGVSFRSVYDHEEALIAIKILQSTDLFNCLLRVNDRVTMSAWYAREKRLKATTSPGNWSVTSESKKISDIKTVFAF
jgi:hypothetical protein